MKNTLTAIFFLFALNLTAQEYSIESNGDSLTIYDFDITNNPFDFGLDPYSRLLNEPNVKVEFDTFENVHNDQIDTLFSLKIEQDRFDVFRKNANESFITDALLLGKTFTTHLGFHVEMDKEDCKKILSKYKISTIPNYIRLENFEISESFEITFENDKISSIVFNGYSD